MLQLERLEKAYGAHRAVDGLSLSLAAGEIVGLLGPNGAGKSTTVAMIAGLLAPDAGTVTLDGLATTDLRARRRIGLAPQALALYERLSAQDNLAFFAGLYGLRGAAATTAITRVLEAVQLQDRRQDRVASFSGGMKRRLNLAAALVHDPDIILLDEPTAGVDPQSRAQLFDTILQLRAAGKAVLYTTHYMEEAERLCDRIAIVDHGRLLALDTLDGLLARHGGDSELIWRCGDDLRRISTPAPQHHLREWLAESGSDAARISVRPPSLENVFLHLTGRQLRD